MHVLAARSEVVPAGQVALFGAPAWEYVSASHDAHELELVAAVLFENEPAGQGVQLDAAEWSA